MDKLVASRLEKKLGADVVEDLDVWVRGIVTSESVTKDQFGQIISRLDGLEDRMDGLENRIDLLDERTQILTNEMTSFRAEVNQRFLSIDQRFLNIDQRLDSFRSDIDQRLDTINERIVSIIKWTVGTIALFGTIITVLMAGFNFVP